MKIYKNKKLFQVLVVCFILSVSFLLLLYFLTTKGIYIQIGTPPNGIHHYFLNCLLIFFTFLSGIYLIHYKFNDKGLTIIAIGISSFISVFVLLYGLMTLEAKYTKFSSPNKQENFVVIETGHGEVYQLLNTGLFMTHLTDIRTDDGFKPFSDGAYQLEWKKTNELLVKYVFDYMSPENYHEVTVTYKSTQIDE
ncbi:hypothetical protein JFL43_19995 [Viridibacillus sp. YIM B01967]|uniref:Uncharacterized protein n=1 Tax=Viridibacillus soli TaxID=2798301 RepID=A0ABS1HCA2_9BACL|nr:hypothetical protein [Viridibacillus soli]MBK3497077.1 hypothetical protein [Viridibacillus soli]